MKKPQKTKNPKNHDSLNKKNSPQEKLSINLLLTSGKFKELELYSNSLLNKNPKNGQAWKMLWLALKSQGIESFHCLINANTFLPADAGLHLALADEYAAKRNYENAEFHYSRCIEINPVQHLPFHHLANLQNNFGLPDLAKENYLRALLNQPDFFEAYFNLGNIERQSRNFDSALYCYKKTIEINPDFFMAHANLGDLYLEIMQIDSAIHHLMTAVKIAPHIAINHVNLSSALARVARIDEAILCMKTALECDPYSISAHSSLIYLLHFHENLGAHDILLETRKLSERLRASVIRRKRKGFTQKPGQKRIRIGYVSPDFRNHCQSFFTIPLLSNHDHEKFEIFCYADIEALDRFGETIKNVSDTWRIIHRKPNEEVAEIIRNDEIDILVDLTMHMNAARPELFFMKPAPVQIAWLAYPGTTGIDGMDYRFTDPWLDPPSEPDNVYSEESFRLPDTFWCYDPLTTDHAGGVLPALHNGYITFGCLNNFCKFSNINIAPWSRILWSLPSSRLLMLVPNGYHRAQILSDFSACGVRPERISFTDRVPRTEYLDLYKKIDICLDTLPYNGHTTSLDAFWMGVPVVSHIGKTVVGRAGWSQLNNLGMPELAAFDEDEFVGKAVALAKDYSRLKNIRSTLRQRLEASPLMDGGRFSRSIEAAYDKIWRKYLNKRKSAE